MAETERPTDLAVSQEPIKYYEGFLDKKGPRDKDYEKTWVILEDEQMMTYSQRLAQRERGTVKPIDLVTIDKHTDVKQNDKEKTKLTVKFKTGVYKFKMATLDERDNWWIRFYAMAKLDIPNIHLLPGQIIALQEIIDYIKIRRGTDPTPHSPLVPAPSTGSPAHKVFKPKPDINREYHFYPPKLVRDYKDDFPIPPTWFFRVSRGQAEELLLNNPEHGGIIIRESESHPGEFSLSMRQEPPIGKPTAPPTIKHFRFSWDNSAATFRMLIEEVQPVMGTMYDLLAFFIEKHGGFVRPMQTNDPSILKRSQHPYELELRGSKKDPENGEAKHKSNASHESHYLQPQRSAVAPEPPSSQRPARKSLPASFNNQFLPSPPPQLASSPRGATGLPSSSSFKAPTHTQRRSRDQRSATIGTPSELANQFPSPRAPGRGAGNRRNCVSTSFMEENPNVPESSAQNMATELNAIFHKFGVNDNN